LISKEEQVKRIMRTFEDFSLILPVYQEEQRRIVRMTLGKDIAILIPAWFRDLSTICQLNQDAFVEYAEYIRSSLDYILGNTDYYQQPEVDEILRQKLTQAINVELINQQRKDAKIAKKMEQPKKA